MAEMAASLLKEQTTALHYASERGHLPVVQALLDGGADARARDGVSLSSWL